MKRIAAAPVEPGAAFVTTDSMARLAQSLRQDRQAAERAGREARSDAPQHRPLQRDALAFLVEAGRLPPESARAGREIAEVFYAIVGGIGRVTAQYGERLGGGEGGDWAPRIRMAYAERYVPWSDWAGRRAIGRSDLRSLTLLVAADNLGCTPAGQRIGAHKTTALKGLRASLWWYAETAGWVKRSWMGGDAEMAA